MEKTLVIGVAGGTGSGKTTLSRAIADKINHHDIVIIQHDSYYMNRSYLPLSERESINYDHPDALETNLLLQHLKELFSGNQVEIPVYDFTTHTRKKVGNRIGPAKVIIIEGVLIFTDRLLRELIDIKIFVDTDDDIRFIRRLQRDTIERQRSIESVIKQYMECVRPMHIEFAERSKRYADIIVSEAHNHVFIDLVLSMINSKIDGSKKL